VAQPVRGAGAMAKLVCVGGRGRRALAGISVAALLAAAGSARAGGTPENAILVIDPHDPVSLQVGNHYRRVRNIPPANVIYQTSWASNFPAFVDGPNAAMVGTLTARGNLDRADYVVVAPTSTFFISAPGLLDDSCSPVNRFSISSAYALAPSASRLYSVVNGTVTPTGLGVQEANRYFGSSDAVVAFSSQNGYVNGSVSTSGTAWRYRIGALLGYTGTNGNTPAEIIAMIDRSAAVDGTRPSGTFYFLSNTGDPGRNVRSGQYSTAATSITSRGGTASSTVGVLPPAGTTNALGIMTGVESYTLSGTPLRPGSFADNVTSWAGTFDIASQTKISRWIAGGASASAGAVEEPCNYTGKFPHARLHVWSFQGLSLGEAYLRSLSFIPAQSLLLGDPLTRAFAFLPTVNPPTLPSQPASGVISITPSGSATQSGAQISTYELYVNGNRVQTVNAGSLFSLDTRTLPDGPHELRILARDNSAARNVGRWIGSLSTLNFGRSATLGVSTASGNLATAFTFTPVASGGKIREVRLVQNGRVIAATGAERGFLAPMTLYGHNLGAGTSSVVAEVVFADYRQARSAPVEVTVAEGGAAVVTPPVAFSYTKRLTPGQPQLVELPIGFGSPPNTASTANGNPPQASVASAFGLFRVITPTAAATGSDVMTFSAWVSGGSGGSNTARITLRYSPEPVGCAVDYNLDGALNLDDLGDFITDFYTTTPIPAGLQPSAPSAPTVGFPGLPCPAARDAPAPYAADAYRRFGYRAAFAAEGGDLCPLAPDVAFPNLDALNDFITAFYHPEQDAACP
jgi:hypothetical protein